MFRRLARTLATAAVAITLALALASCGTGSSNQLAFKPGKLTNGCAFSARGIPACGTYLGEAYGANTDPTSFEEQIGHRLGVHRTYYTAGQVDTAVATAREDIAHGRLPWISFKPPYSWSDMASGRGDSWARDLATKLAALPGPVWIAVHHEPEGEGDLAQWRRMQERLAPIIRSTAANVAYTVILTGWDEIYRPSEYPLASIWPHTKIDVAGFDVYDSPTMVSKLLVPLAHWAAHEHVPWALAETGYTDEQASADPLWVAHTYREVNRLGGVAFSYFNSPLNSPVSYTLSTQEEVAEFARAVRDAPALPVAEPRQ